MRVESGPAKWDFYRYLAMTLVFIGWWAYCYYDGTWGWVNKNREEARAQLVPKVGETREIPDELGQTPTKPEAQAILGTRPDVTELRRRFGEPFFTSAGERPDETVEYYVSDYGMLEVTKRFNRVVKDGIKWTGWYKTKAQIEQQYYWGAAGLVIAAIAGFYFVRAARFRLVVDDQGLDFNGRRIPFERMTGFSNYSRKGWIDLNYGADKPLRLDNQQVAKFDETIDAICQAKGFPDPRRDVAIDLAEGDAPTEPAGKDAPTADSSHGDG